MNKRGRPTKAIEFESLTIKGQADVEMFEDYLLDAELVYERAADKTKRFMRERTLRWLQDLENGLEETYQVEN